MKGILLILTVILACDAKERFECSEENSKLLTATSPDVKLFKVRAAGASGPNSKRVLFGNGYIKEDENPFRTDPDTDQDIVVRREDGGAFAVQRLAIKSVNSDKVIITGTPAQDETLTLNREKEPKGISSKRGEGWEKTKFRPKDMIMITELKITVKLHDVPTTAPVADRKMKIRGLRLRACFK